VLGGGQRDHNAGDRYDGRDRHHDGHYLRDYHRRTGRAVPRDYYYLRDNYYLHDYHRRTGRAAPHDDHLRNAGTSKHHNSCDFNYHHQ
jgi:hypothetical protein